MVLSDLEKKDFNVESMVKKALKDEKVLSAVLKGILSKKDTIRFNSFKVLLTISEENPAVLYPHWDSFADLLISDNAYRKYIALYIIANLVRIDTDSKFEEIFDTYYRLLDDEGVIPASHLALNSGKIAKAKPELQTEITSRLLRIDETHHKPERRDLIKGYIIEAFSEYYEEAADQEEILQFVKDQLESKSPTTRKKAKEFLEKWER